MWHDPDSNIVVYEGQDSRLLQWTHDAQPIAGQYIAMPGTLHNMQIMRLLGYPVIRPLVHYDFPRSRAIKQPFHAQTETANFLVTAPRACVLSDMGTGKTLSSLWAADALMREAEQRGQRLRAVILAPLSTLQSVWMDALFQHFLGRRKGIICHGSEEKRIKNLAADVDFYILNHDAIKVGASLNHKRKLVLSGFAGALEARQDIRLAIIDEVGAFRDHRSQRSRVAKHLLGKRDFLWLMTGTPIPNGPLDAFGIAKLLNNAKGEVFTNYKLRTMFQLSQYKWVPKVGAHEEAMRLLEPFIRFPIEACVDLPELTVQNRDVDLTAEQIKLLKELKKELLVEMKRGNITVANEAALRTKLIQICCGAVYDENHHAYELDCGPRIKALREIIENEAAKVIVFAPFISVVNYLNRALKGFSHSVITGETPPSERAEIMRKFQQEADPRVILAHPEPIARGQTLTAAATTVWWGPIDKTETYIQANKRMHRPGQTRPCTVVNFAGSAIEREVFRRLAANESMQGLMLKLAEAA